MSCFLCRLGIQAAGSSGQAHLSNLGLVWSVLCIPAWVLEQVAHDNLWGVCSVVSHANVALCDLVLGGHLPTTVRCGVVDCVPP